MTYLKLFSWAFAALFAALAAWFEIVDRAQLKKEREHTKRKFKRLWLIIKENNLTYLPQLAIIYFINLRSELINKAQRTVGWLEQLDNARGMEVWDVDIDTRTSLLDKLQIIVTYIAMLFMFHWLFGILIGAVITILFFIISGVISILSERTKSYSWYLTAFLLRITELIIMMIFGLFVLDMALNEVGIFSVLFVLALIPIYTLLIGDIATGLAQSLRDWNKKLTFNLMLIHILDNGVIIGFSISISFFVTVLSFWFGQLICSECAVEPSMQMIISNTLFDALTLLVTFKILEKTIPLFDIYGAFIRYLNKPIGVLSAIIQDVIIAALFACASLYFSFIYSDNHISLLETLRVLVGLSPESNSFEFGPRFWVMHTTFIPTLVYLSIILFCWIGKLFILPIALFTNRAMLIEQPHHLTAGVFAFLAVLFTIISTGIGNFN